MTDTDATERAEPQSAAQDPGLSPVVDHSAVTMHSPVPKVIAHRAPEPDTIDRVERGRAASSWRRSARPVIGSSVRWRARPA